LIHVICKYGESIPPEVVKGIADTSHSVMVISSPAKEGGLDRANIHLNWTTAMKYFDGDVFFGMDSDIVIKYGSTIALSLAMIEADFAFIATGPSNTHGIWAVKRRVIDAVPMRQTDTCPICEWKNDIVEAGYKIKRVPEMVQHVRRITIKEAENGRS